MDVLLNETLVVHLFVPALVIMSLHGMYTVLFCICVYILYTHKYANRKTLSASIIAMFLLSTGALVITLIVSFKYGAMGIAVTARDFFYILENIISDGLLIFRCFVIWGRKKKIIIVPSVLLLATTVLGIQITIFNGLENITDHGLLPRLDPRVPFYTSLATNIVVTLLSAGRIWWVSREIRISLGKNVVKKYNTAIAMIVESGSIFCVAIITYLIILSIDNHDDDSGFFRMPGLATEIAFSVMTQIVGIVPTLLVVQTGLGITSRDAYHTVMVASGIRFDADRESS